MAQDSSIEKSFVTQECKLSTNISKIVGFPPVSETGFRANYSTTENLVENPVFTVFQFNLIL
jgi:hypothetical protein